MDENIKTYRIGNELKVFWPILTNGEEESLSGRRISLFLTDPLNVVHKIERFGTEGNAVVWVFPGEEQKLTGLYTLTLFENLGGAHQTATDCVKAFRLVKYSNEIPSSMQVEELPLASTNMDVGIRGLSAYEIAVNYGYEGSEEQWAQEFNTVLTSTQIVTEAVERAEHVLERTEELFHDLSDIQQAELQRVENEGQRQQNEQTRQQQEQQRATTFATNEQARQQSFTQAQQQRQQAFETAEQQRGQTFTTNETQRGQTFTANERERESSFTENEQARQQTFETNEQQRESGYHDFITDIETAEGQRADAEAVRAQNEQERQQNEAARTTNEGERQRGEASRVENEAVRRSQENNRVSNETQRQEAEVLRERNEQLRVQQDTVIAEAERLRAQAELQRGRNETDRMTAEVARERAKQQMLADVAAAIADFNRTRVVLQTQATVEINPNVLNLWSSPMAALTITFAAGDSRYADEYKIQFQCPSDAATDLHLPSSLKWVDDEPLEPEAGFIYQISVIDNLALYAGWEAQSE